MARFSFFAQFLLLSFAAFFLASNSSVIQVGQSHRAVGVFLLIEGGKYTFNFSAARDACLSLNVTMATRAQMERAVQHGLETCKFGWMDEQIAVVPRQTADPNCGKGKTGVVTWAADTDRQFGVFCYNVSDLEEPSIRSTASPPTSTFPSTATQTFTPVPALLQSTIKKTPPSTELVTTNTPSRKPRTTKYPERTSLTSAVRTTDKTRISSTIKPSSTHSATSLSHLITSKPTEDSLKFSTSTTASGFSSSSESAVATSSSSAKPSLGDVPTALIVLGTILLLLTAAGVVLYYKLNIWTFWSESQQKDDTETEMWKHTDSEMDLQSQHEGEEEESDRRYSSDITLCVNPQIKAHSTE